MVKKPMIENPIPPVAVVKNVVSQSTAGPPNIKSK